MSEQRTQVVVGKSKLTVSDLGNPSMVKAKPEGDHSPHDLGVILGRLMSVRSKQVKQNMTGEISEVPQLLGMFEGRLACPRDNGNGTETTAVRASVLYLPNGIDHMLVQALAAIPEGDPQQVDFAFRIQSVRASNPAGYSYQVINLYQPRASDPLENIRAISMALPTQLLEAPTDEPSAGTSNNTEEKHETAPRGHRAA